MSERLSKHRARIKYQPHPGCVLCCRLVLNGLEHKQGARRKEEEKNQNNGPVEAAV